MSLQDIPTKHEKKIPDLDSQEAENNATLSQDKKKLAVRLLTFIPGKTLYNARPWTTEHFYQCGRLIAQFMVALKVDLMIACPQNQLECFIFICNLDQKRFSFANIRTSKMKHCPHVDLYGSSLVFQMLEDF